MERKKIVSVNLGNLGSTGKIMRGITVLANRSGFDAVEAYPDIRDSLKKEKGDIVIMPQLWRKVSEKLAYYTSFNGCTAVLPTLVFLRKVSRIKPDVLHFHNLHNSYINLPLLFRYVKRRNISVVWTLHDCWAFTGHCAYFTLSGCDKWKTGCGGCRHYRDYPFSFADNTRRMYRLKKKWFTGVKDLTIVTPSEWLAGLVRQSYLKEYPVEVINNGIDLNVFRPTESDFREKYAIGDRHMILGVSFCWEKRKGLDVFIELAKRVDDSYQIVLVGTNDGIDRTLPENVISIHRTQDQRELAQIYTAADVFVNPTREENYPTVNMEALACGTPVVTFNTGGSPEIPDEKTGAVVECDDIDALTEKIVSFCEASPDMRGDCLKRAESFAAEKCFGRYIELYKRVTDEK